MGEFEMVGMTANCLTTNLISVAEVIMGQSPPGTTYNEVGEGLPFYQGIADFGPRFPTKRVFCTAPTRIAEAGDILFSVRAPIGQVNLAAERCAIGRGLAIIRPRDQKDRIFIEFVLRSKSAEWHALEGEGSVFGNAKREDLESLEIVWPHQTDRRSIANILGTLDDKIELNRRMNETLEAMARAIFKSWFVDATENGIPKEWTAGTLGNVAENPRRTVNPSEVKPETPYIGLEHMPRRSIALAEWGRAGDVASGKARFIKREILFGKLRPYFHKVGVAVFDGVCSTDILTIRPKAPEWHAFVLCLLSSNDLVDYADACSTGTKMPRVSWTDLARYEVALPPPELAAKFDAHVQAMLDKIIANIMESRTLAAIRDALLPKLLSGEIRVKDAEIFCR